jgi:hypothetical protein
MWARAARSSSGRSTSCASSRAESIRRSSPRRACPRRWSRWRNGPPFPSGLPPALTHGCPSRSRPWPTSWCRNPWRTSRNMRASGARIALSRCNGTLRVEIVDDGIGGADASRGSGLRGLEDRVSAVRGSFRVQTRATGNPCPSRDPLRHLNRPADGDPAATPGAVASDHLTARPRTLGIDVTFRKGGSSRLAALVRTVGAGGVGALGATFRGTCAARTFRGAGRYRGCDR